MKSHAKAAAAVLASLLVTLGGSAISATAIAPVVSIDAPSSVSYTSARVTGTVDPEDQETYFYFQYAIDPESEGWTSGPQAYSVALAPGSGPTAVAETLTGLKPGTEYEVRLVAENFSEPAQTISAEPNPTFTTLAVASPSATLDPITTFTGTTAHFSGQVNPNAPEAAPTTAAVETAFRTSWQVQCEPACPGALQGSVAADNVNHGVTADATGLAPNTSYDITLTAQNAGGQVSSGPLSFQTPAIGPEVVGTFIAGFGSSTASLGAEVKAGGLATTYRFEYVDQASFDATGFAGPNVRSTPQANLANSDNLPQRASASVSGLSPNTRYRFRAIATNAVDTATGETESLLTAPSTAGGACANEAIRTQTRSLALPDCRAYEMVSPLKKDGWDAGAASGSNQVTYAAARPDGSRILFVGGGGAVGEANAGLRNTCSPTAAPTAGGPNRRSRARNR